jgi:16S rRNA (uracil1498-N3)-methyltransferase
MRPDLWPDWENGVSARFYSPDAPRDGKLRLVADEAKHLSRVCRFGLGDVVEVFDGKGGATRAEVVKIDNEGVELTVVGAAMQDRKAPLRLTLASAVPKGDRFDWLVEKSTELGIERLIPIVTERSVVAPGASKLERVRKAIIEASKQCGRNQLMVLDHLSRWEHLVGTCAHAIKLIADPAGIPPRRWPGIAPGRLVVFAVGPEGGFTDQEQQIADQMGWIAISLSVNTLRIETAGLAGCAALLTHVKEPDP